MRKCRQLAMVAAAVTLIGGASAFAESRPSNETRTRGEAGSVVRRGATAAGSEVSVEARRGNDSRNRSGASSGSSGSYERRSEGRAYERRNEGRTERGDEGRTYERRDQGRSTSRGNDGYRNGGNDRGDRDRNRGNGDNHTWRGAESQHRDGGRYDRNRGGSYYGNRGGSYYGNRQPYTTRGRVSHYQRYGGGYRVWIVGAPYPFYVPLAYWSPSRFRIGVTLGLGGYYNPGGYYDYWDGYRDGYYSDREYHGYSRADFEGEVESVDYRGSSFVVRNEDTGNYVTVVLRDRNEPFPRPGDYVEVRGDWTTRGYFRAYDVELLDTDRYRDRY